MSESENNIEPKAKPDERKGLLASHLIEVLVVVAIVALLILAYLSYNASLEDKNELSVTVTPDTVDLNAGETIALRADVFLDDEPVDDLTNAAFEWTLSNTSLGTLNVGSSNLATMIAGSEIGEGVITCVVNYTLEDVVLTASAEVEVTVLPAALSQVIVDPEAITVVYDEVVVFNATAVDTLGANISDLEIAWTVEGIAASNYTLNSTTGSSVNFTANATGTAWVNASATYGGVVKNGSAIVNVIKEVPVVDITLTTKEQKLIVWTFTEPSSELSWGDLVIYLTDQTETVNWSISSTGLDNGSLSIALYDPKVIGGDTIWLNITDQLGNGAVNATDTISFTTDGRFNPSKTYRISIEFVPKSVVIVSKDFTGV